MYHYPFDRTPGVGVKHDLKHTSKTVISHDFFRMFSSPGSRGEQFDQWTGALIHGGCMTFLAACAGLRRWPSKDTHVVATLPEGAREHVPRTECGPVYRWVESLGHMIGARARTWVEVNVRPRLHEQHRQNRTRQDDHLHQHEYRYRLCCWEPSQIQNCSLLQISCVFRLHRFWRCRTEPSFSNAGESQATRAGRYHGGENEHRSRFFYIFPVMSVKLPTLFP